MAIRKPSLLAKSKAAALAAAKSKGVLETRVVTIVDGLGLVDAQETIIKGQDYRTLSAYHILQEYRAEFLKIVELMEIKPQAPEMDYLAIDGDGNPVDMHKVYRVPEDLVACTKSRGERVEANFKLYVYLNVHRLRAARGFNSEALEEASISHTRMIFPRQENLVRILPLSEFRKVGLSRRKWTLLFQKLLSIDRYGLESDHSGCLRFLTQSILIDGIHYGERQTDLPDDWYVVEIPDVGTTLIIANDMKQRGDFICMLPYPKSGNKLIPIDKIAAIIMRAQSLWRNRPATEEELTAAYVKQSIQTILKELSTREKSMASLERSLQETAEQVARLRTVVEAVQSSGIDSIRRIVTEMKRADYHSPVYQQIGLLLESPEMWIDIGNHETGTDRRYLGVFQVCLYLEGGISVLNIASPARDLNHPYFSHDLACLGGYRDTLRQAVLTQDYYVVGLALTAMLTHFDEGRRSQVLERLPSTRPEKTFQCERPVVVFGKVFTDNAAEHRRGDDDDDEAE